MERILTLNASYLPLGLVSWMKAIRLVWQGKAQVIAEGSRKVRSPSTEMNVPSVIRLVSNVFVSKKRVRLNRKNVFARDDHTCQYCGEKFAAKHLNLDHVVPASRGGQKSWDNIVTACILDNSRKADRTPEEAGMKLLSKPTPPNWTIFKYIKAALNGQVPDEWGDFLPAVS